MTSIESRIKKIFLEHIYNYIDQYVEKVIKWLFFSSSKGRI